MKRAMRPYKVMGYVLTPHSTVLPPWVRALVSAVVIIPLMTYVMMPFSARLLRNFLYHS